MADDQYVVLDTSTFNKALEKKQPLVDMYYQLNNKYDAIVKKLMESWKGSGATAFAEDAKIVRTNLVGVFEILKMMCDTLEDCKEIFSECDHALGEYNRDPESGT